MGKAGFVGNFEKQVLHTIKKYKLIRKGDKILVAVSGGKDSTTVLYILDKYFDNIEAITIDASIGDYSRQSLKNITKFCREHKIKLHVVSFRKELGSSLCYMRSALKSRGIRLTSCSICGILKRYLLNKKALLLKASKLATGHNLDDEAQSFMINLLRCNLKASERLAPVSGVVEDKKFVPRIKPLYLASEAEVEKYSRLMGFPVVYGYCQCSVDAYRRFIGGLIDRLEKENKKIKINIVSYFLKKMKGAKERHNQEKVRYCSKCHMPSKAEFCRTCQILGMIKQ